ncbi:hypothetical protein C8R44DRAFT_729738 [Mycena epipterygia]|nr:hypothetical protein C8R44DRAFT_729738 [Mycena epipterygia]
MRVAKISMLFHEAEPVRLGFLASYKGIGEVIENFVGELRRESGESGLRIVSSLLEFLEGPIRPLRWNICCGQDRFDRGVDKENSEDLSVPGLGWVEETEWSNAMLNVGPREGTTGARSLEGDMNFEINGGHASLLSSQDPGSNKNSWQVVISHRFR